MISPSRNLRCTLNRHLAYYHVVDGEYIRTDRHPNQVQLDIADGLCVDDCIHEHSLRGKGLVDLGGVHCQ